MKMQPIHFIYAFFLASAMALPTDNDRNGLLGTGIGVPKGLLGTQLLDENLLSDVSGSFPY